MRRHLYAVFVHYFDRARSSWGRRRFLAHVYATDALEAKTSARREYRAFVPSSALVLAQRDKAMRFGPARPSPAGIGLL